MGAESDLAGHPVCERVNLTELIAEAGARLARLIIQQHEQTRSVIMSTQADVDALTAQVTTMQTNLTAGVAAIQAEISSLQGQGVDVTNLQAAVTALAGTVDSADAIAPAPSPSPDPNPAPSGS